MSVFLSCAGGFATWFRASGRGLPSRIDGRDLMLLTVASHKASRMIAKDRVTSAVRAPFTRYQGDDGLGEVSEQARGRGLRRAIGELPVCPYCLGSARSLRLHLRQRPLECVHQIRGRWNDFCVAASLRSELTTFSFEHQR